MPTPIRIVRESDAAAIRAIYAPYVADTPISFEIDVPTVEEMEQRIATLLPRYPWLVYENTEGILGYAYASPHRARPAYQWSMDVTVYVAPEAQRRGVGRALYTALFDVLRRQGFVRAFAGITLPNEKSVGLHEALGFRPLGVYHAIGYKCGAWHDVGWWSLALQEPPADPAPPAPLTADLLLALQHTALLDPERELA